MPPVARWRHWAATAVSCAVLGPPSIARAARDGVPGRGRRDYDSPVAGLTPPQLVRESTPVASWWTPPQPGPASVTPSEPPPADIDNELEDLRRVALRASVLPPRGALAISCRLLRAAEARAAELRPGDVEQILEILGCTAAVHGLSRQSRTCILRTIALVPRRASTAQVMRSFDLLDTALYGPEPPLHRSLATAAWSAVDAFAQCPRSTESVLEGLLTLVDSLAVGHCPNALEGLTGAAPPRALRSLGLVVENAAAPLGTVGRAVERLERLAAHSSPACRLAARDALLRATRRLAARGAPAPAGARALWAARSLSSAARLEEAFGFPTALCAEVLRVIGEARAPIRPLAPALVRRGLAPELLQRISGFAATPGLARECGEAVARCAAVAREAGDARGDIVAALWDAVCAEPRAVGLEAAVGFAAAAAGTAWEIRGEDLERVASCLEPAPGEARTETLVAAAIAAANGAAVLVRRTSRRSRGFDRGVGALCRVAMAHSASAPNSSTRVQPRFADICGAAPGDLGGARALAMS